MLEDCSVYSKPSNQADIKVAAGDFVVMVQFDKEVYKKQFTPVKKALSIPSWLNEAAEAVHINFSRVLQATLKQRLHNAE